MAVSARHRAEQEPSAARAITKIPAVGDDPPIVVDIVCIHHQHLSIQRIPRIDELVEIDQLTVFVIKRVRVAVVRRGFVGSHDLVEIVDSQRCAMSSGALRAEADHLVCADPIHVVK